MNTLDKKTWARREIYDMFSKIDYPFYSVTIPINVTNIKKISKNKGVSFYFLMIWACTKAVNSVPEFRYRIRGDEIIILDQVNPSFTYMPNNSETFQIITLEWEEKYEMFCFNAKEQSKKQIHFMNMEKETDALIYFSCTPWFDFTSLTNEHSFNKDDTIPRLTWGKYYEKDSQLWVHLSVEVNHRTIDGIHIGKLKNAIDYEINTLG